MAVADLGRREVVLLIVLQRYAIEVTGEKKNVATVAAVAKEKSLSRGASPFSSFRFRNRNRHFSPL